MKKLTSTRLYFTFCIFIMCFFLAACGTKSETLLNEIIIDTAKEGEASEITDDVEEKVSNSFEETDLSEEAAESPDTNQENLLEENIDESLDVAEEIETLDTYEQILDRAYKVISDEAPDDTFYDGEIGMLEVKGDYGTEEALTKIGYCLLDIDNNGIEELIICEYYANSPSRVLAMYTMKDQKAVLIAEGWFRDRYYILNDGRIYNEGSGGAMNTIFGTYHFAQDGTSLELENYYFSDYMNYNDEDSWGWFRSEYMDLSNYEKIEFSDEDEPFNMMEDFKLECKKLDLTMFSEYKK